MTAILFYGVGDVVTTTVGLGMEGLTEAGPLLAFLIEQYDLDVAATFVAAVGVKAAFLGGCYAVWKRLPRPQCVSVPLGLSLVGIPVTAWNAYHVIYLAQPF
ncbi:putative membrane protein [Halapricum desulfuricans]|uniref:Putative membrane protein n=1 Tax=Halapricum desulfuricans TaxID=2841257 RepID=A0A897N9G8_9EURY|nr:putative membrane protein [Halapricum desulfuricans]